MFIAWRLCLSSKYPFCFWEDIKQIPLLFGFILWPPYNPNFGSVPSHAMAPPPGLGGLEVDLNTHEPHFSQHMEKKKINNNNNNLQTNALWSIDNIL